MILSHCIDVVVGEVLSMLGVGVKESPLVSSVSCSVPVQRS